VSRLCGFYPGICLTTEGKARKNHSQGSALFCYSVALSRHNFELLISNGECQQLLQPNVYCIVLYCIVLYCIVFYFSLFYFIVFYCIVLYCIVLYCTVLYCIVLYCQTNDNLAVDMSLSRAEK
jgi:hypothetical protein